MFGTFDQDIHTRESADTAQCFSDAHKTVMGNPAPEGTNFAAQFGHMAGRNLIFMGLNYGCFVLQFFPSMIFCGEAAKKASIDGLKW